MSYVTWTWIVADTGTCPSVRLDHLLEIPMIIGMCILYSHARNSKVLEVEKEVQ